MTVEQEKPKFGPFEANIFVKILTEERFTGLPDNPIYFPRLELPV
jgi:hypothetical protein